MLNIQGVANKPVLIGDVEKYKIEKKTQKSLTVKPETKQKSNFQIKKLFEDCFPERKPGKFMKTWLR